MFVKAQLHFHNGEDPVDKYIDYSPYEAIDFAQKLWFKILSFTNHNFFWYNKKIKKYAFDKWIILINWIELSIRKKHVLIYNPTKEILKIKTFKDLTSYKDLNKNIFIMAPHPYYKAYFCLGKTLEKYHEIFDGVEYSSLHTQNMFTKANHKAESFALKYKKPFLWTWDVHDLNFLNDTYSLINIDFDIDNLEFSKFDFYIKNIFENIKQNNLKIVSKPLNFRSFFAYNWVHIKWFVVKKFFCN